MKTKEQFKQDVISYIKKSSYHTFLKPSVSGDPTYFKVYYNDGSDNFTVLEDGKRRSYNIDSYMGYEGNAKCVISHMLFLDKKMKSVRQTKFVKEAIALI